MNDSSEESEVNSSQNTPSKVKYSHLKKRQEKKKRR
jgi:hypothetical protein